MHFRLLSAFFLFGILLLNAFAENRELTYGAFAVYHEIVLPGKPVNIFDAVTGNISGWWDHSFSDSAVAFYIEPKPGGGFFEIYDDEGNGIKHAEVIAADRGKLLRFVGPLGLSGKAIQLVTTYELKSEGSDSTRLILSVHASGEISEGIAEVVDKTWHHFLFERLKPYLVRKTGVSDKRER